MNQEKLPTNLPHLISTLKNLLDETEETGSHALIEFKNQNYWKMGQELQKLKTANSTIDEHIASALNKDRIFVSRIRNFYKVWPHGLSQSAKAISWSCHIELLSLDSKKRLFYLDETLKQGWARDTLRKAIQLDYYNQPDTRSKMKTSLQREANPLYLFKAIIQDVIDGDTLLVQIDAGFNMLTNQRIRLNGINTPELPEKSNPKKTTKAEKAKLFVQDKLKNIPFVILQTFKSDIYGRYLANVFYHPVLTKPEDIAGKGFFLNEELVKAGLAEYFMV